MLNLATFKAATSIREKTDLSFTFLQVILEQIMSNSWEVMKLILMSFPICKFPQRLLYQDFFI